MSLTFYSRNNKESPEPEFFRASKVLRFYKKVQKFNTDVPVQDLAVKPAGQRLALVQEIYPVIEAPAQPLL